MEAETIHFNAATIMTGAGGDQEYIGDVVLFTPVTVTGDDVDFGLAANTLDLDTHSLTVDTTSAGSEIVSTIISTGGDLTKAGLGTLTLKANNTYTGNTDVNAGTLTLSFASNNNISSSPIITVAAGATLDVTGLTGGLLELAELPDAGGDVLQLLRGNGTVTGDVTALAGSSIGPGLSTGILTVDGDVTFDDDSVFEVEINDVFTPGTDYDQLDVNGTVTINDADLILVDGFGGTGAPGDTLVLIDNDPADAVIGTFEGLPNGSDVPFNGESWRIFYDGGDGNDVVLAFVEADLSITKSANPDPVRAGDSLIYTVTVSNAGPSDALNVVVTDTLSADVNFVATTGCAEDPGGVPTCSLGAIVAGGSAQYTIEVTVNLDAPALITNQAIVASSTTDPDPSDNSTSLDTSVKVKDPGFSYVDANNDNRFFAADGDVPLDDGELDDGRFNTDKAEGPDYTVAIAGAGLVINGPAIAVSGDLKYTADGDLVVNTDLTAGDDIELTSRNGSVSLDDPTITAPDEIEIEAALDILSTDDVIEATGPGSEVELKAGRDILLFGTTVEAVREVELKAGRDIFAIDVAMTALDTSRGEVELKATGDINVSGATLLAGKEIELEAGGNIDVAGALLRAGKEVELESGGNVDGDNLTVLDAGAEVEVEAGGDVFLDGASLTAGKEVEIEADGTISVVGATLDAGKEVELEANGNITADGATMTAGKEIEIESKNGSVSLVGSCLNAGKEIEIEARDAIFAALAKMVAGKEIEIESEAGDVDLRGANLCAGKEIEVEAEKILTDPSTVLKASKIKLKERC